MKKIKEKINNKKLIPGILGILGLIVSIIGISYAAWNYTFIGTKTSSISTADISIELLESSNNIISLVNSYPISDQEGIVGDYFDFAVTSRTVKNTAIPYTITIEKLSVESGYTSFADNQIKLYLTDLDNNVLVEPTLVSELTNYELYTGTHQHNISHNKVESKYRLRAWIDRNVDISDWTTNTHIKYEFKIGLSSQESDVNAPVLSANKPILSANMIPVYYDEDSEVWKKADSTNESETYKWYDYNNKIWANSVTVSSTNRSTYLNASPGTTIPMSDILTMQVWIPRYKYKVWNYNQNGSSTNEEQSIDITFEKGTQSTGDITCTDSISGTNNTPSETCTYNNQTCTDSLCNGKTYTHPAFTFGDKELEGIWVGKFETTGTISNITVKPDLQSLRSQQVGAFDNAMRGLNANNNQYGFTTNDDTHMMKNSEWGAVAYLSHSKYGTNKEVYINNSSTYYTGRSGGNVGGSTAANTVYANQTSTSQYNNYGYYTYDGYLLNYNTNTKSSTKDITKVGSTTGNIYGIYDMSGGAWEYTMSNIVSNDGTTMMSGNSTSYNSGYTGKIYNSNNITDYTGTYTYPANKYLDKYSYGTASAQRIRSKLGDGIKEVYTSTGYGWYSDYPYLADSAYPWFYRGGRYNNSSRAGVFHSSYYYGLASSNYSARLVLVSSAD